MKLVKLTEGGKSVWLNCDRIETVRKSPYAGDEKTHVYLAGHDRPYSVKETPEEIAELVHAPAEHVR